MIVMETSLTADFVPLSSLLFLRNPQKFSVRTSALRRVKVVVSVATLVASPVKLAARRQAKVVVVTTLVVNPVKLQTLRRAKVVVMAAIPPLPPLLPRFRSRIFLVGPTAPLMRPRVLPLSAPSVSPVILPVRPPVIRRVVLPVRPPVIRPVVLPVRPPVIRSVLFLLSPLVEARPAPLVALHRIFRQLIPPASPREASPTSLVPPRRQLPPTVATVKSVISFSWMRLKSAPATLQSP